jgi:predicted alpha/beta hydrolase
MEGRVRPIEARSLTITASDGYPLAATLFVHRESTPSRVVIVACAMGVKAAFYEPYARFLANNGVAAVTFDYRGIARSLKGKITDDASTVRDWGEKDYPAVLSEVQKQFPGKPISIVGHSVGGQLLGIVPEIEKVSSVCTVATQHGYWRRYPLWQSIKYALLWYVVVPLLVRLFSYFPARKLRLGENLPKGAALEWARYCRSPHYLVDESGAPMRRGFDGYTGPVLAYWMEDDEISPLSNVEALHTNFAQAKVEYRSVSPEKVGLAREGIGHVGFFKPKMKGVWAESLEWLLAH